MKKYNDFSFVAARMVFMSPKDFEDWNEDIAPRPSNEHIGAARLEDNRKASIASRQEMGFDMEFGASYEREQERQLAQKAYAEKFRDGNFVFKIDVDGYRKEKDVQGHSIGVMDITKEDGEIIGEITLDEHTRGEGSAQQDKAMHCSMVINLDDQAYDREELYAINMYHRSEKALIVNDYDLTADEVASLMESVENYKSIVDGLELEHLKLASGQGVDARKEVSIEISNKEYKNAEWYVKGSILTAQDGYLLKTHMRKASSFDHKYPEIEEKYNSVEELRARLIELDNSCNK